MWVFLFFIGATTCLAQSSLPSSFFSVWDVDKNKKLTHAEFYDGLSGTSLFEVWDYDQDSRIERQEFYDGLLEQADYSARVPDEFNYRASLVPGFTSGAALRSSEVKKEEQANPEYAALFREADLNRDGYLNKAEFYTFIFRFLDRDENGFLGYQECTKTALTSWFL